MMKIRSTKHDDIAGLTVVLDGTGLFPSEMLPGMLDSGLNDVDSQDVWLTAESEGQITGFCFASPEMLANGVWNMLAIAVLPDMQGKGCGAALAAQLEAELRAQGHRILIADTSGTDEFAQTRAFYRKNGYTEEARIRDFWDEGDDKVIFWKSLG